MIIRDEIYCPLIADHPGGCGHLSKVAQVGSPPATPTTIAPHLPPSSSTSTHDAEPIQPTGGLTNSGSEGESIGTSTSSSLRSLSSLPPSSTSNTSPHAAAPSTEPSSVDSIPNNSPAAAPTTHFSTDTIAGGVVGGVAVITVFLIVFWSFRKRRKTSRGYQSPQPPNPNLGFTNGLGMTSVSSMGWTGVQHQFTSFGLDTGASSSQRAPQHFQPHQVPVGVRLPGKMSHPALAIGAVVGAGSSGLDMSEDGIPESGATSSSNGLVHNARSLTAATTSRPGPAGGVLASSGQPIGKLKNAASEGGTRGLKRDMRNRLPTVLEDVPPPYDELFNSSQSTMVNQT